VNQAPAPSSPPSTASRAPEHRRAARLLLPAELSATAIDRLRDELYQHVRRSPVPVVLDGRAVRHISPAGIGVLVAAALLAQANGTSVRIDQPSESLRQAVRGYAGAGLILDQPPASPAVPRSPAGIGGSRGLTRPSVPTL
jgi:anti-anti-sigma regulatory factor